MRSTILQFCFSTVLYFKDDLWPSRRLLLVVETVDINIYVCIKTYLYYISRDFSTSLAIEMYGGHFFLHHPYIGSTTVLINMKYMCVYNI